MALTLPDPKDFINLKNQICDTQLDNAIDKYAKAQPRKQSKTWNLDDLAHRVELLEAKEIGHKNYWKDVWIPRYWNPALDRITTEVGYHRLSDPLVNWLSNGGFTIWDSATVANGWTAAGSPTISQQTRRTGARADTFALRIASGGSAGSVSRTVKFKAGAENILALAGWVKINGSSDTVTISLTDNGASPTTVSVVFTGSVMGTAAWFAFPRIGYDVLRIQPANDATTLTLKLEVSANGQADFSELQFGPGPQRDPDLWTSAAEDITSAPALKLPAAVIKANTEQVTSSTTLQNDDELLLPILASESKSCTFTIKAGQALATTGIKVAVTSPSGSTISVMANMVDTAGSSRTIFAVASGVPCDFTTAVFAGNDATLTITANVANGGTSGNVTLQWAQSTSSGTPLIVAAGSSVTGIKV